MSFHKSPLHAERMQKLLTFLRERGQHGATTLEINEHCSSTRASSDVSELRANGVRVVMSYEGKTESGRKIHRYAIVEERSADCPNPQRGADAESNEPATAPCPIARCELGQLAVREQPQTLCC